MKEIDFLPEWYKQGCLQQKKHREFYIALGLIVFIMAAWSIFANGRVAIVQARNTMLNNAKFIQDRSKTEVNKAENEYEQLKAKYQILQSIKPNITVSNVIAELTHLLDGGVILKRLEIKAEPFTPEKNVRYKIKIAGLAADPGRVAEVINQLEQSDYFFQIVPGFSKNATMGQYQASEFEIACYLANYKMTK